MFNFNCMKQNAVLFSFIIIIIVILHTTNVASQFDHNLRKQIMKEWLTYKETYGKNYSTAAESIRKSVWEQNFLKVLKHNQEAAMGLHNYTLKTNHLADMDIKEYVQEMIKLLKSLRKTNVGSMLSAPHYDPAKIPEELDWREKGYNTPVQNQEDCGACYAFAIASSIEAQHFIKSGQLKLLSQQQMVDCSKSTGNMGCRGGSFRNTLRYVEEYGLTASSVYPYRAKESKCKYKKSEKVVGIHAWRILPSQDEYALKVAVATVGPVAVSINASPSTFQLYHEGVYDDKKCTSDQVNHAMLLVGYTKNAWILKNWWSDSWGEKGYMYLKRGQNHCGVANFAAYGIL